MTGVVRGSLLMVGMRWTDRLIGLVSTVVLARLLVPQDFGIIAMASLVIALADVLFDLGLHVTLIQNPRPDQATYHTAWTLGLIQGTVAACGLYLAAPYAAGYFHEPRVQSVIQVLGLSLLISSLENIGVVTFQKEMRFGQDFVLQLCRRGSGFAITLLGAWLLQSYWALVIGSVSGRVVGVLCSYAMHPMRPRLSLARWREILGVSQWLLVRTTGGFLESQLHRAVVGRNDSTAMMGAYAVAGDISTLPSNELLMPINRVLFPAFVQVKDQPAELCRVFLLAQGVQSLIAIPASAGLALVAPQLVALMLGPQWLMAVPLLQILALSYLAGAMLSCGTGLLMTLGRMKELALFSWAQVAVFVLLAFGLFGGAQALQVAWLRLAVALLSDLGFLVLLLGVFAPLRLRDLAAGVLRPLLGMGTMATALLLLEPYWAHLPLPLALPAKMLLGAAVYSASVALLWQAAGQPEGAETFVLHQLGRLAPKARAPERPCP